MEQEEREEVGWFAEGEEEPRASWWQHLRHQWARAAVVLLVIFFLSGLKKIGHPGEWALARFKTAIRLDLSREVLRFCSPAKIRPLLAAWRDRLAREWQVNGPGLHGNGPWLYLPLTEASPLNRPDLPRRNRGLDLGAPAGSPVLAAAAGTVIEIRKENDGSLTIVLDHGGGWRTVYGRCQVALVSLGKFVNSRQPIGLLGSAAAPLPPYLHFEVWQGTEPVDPSGLFRAGTV